MRENVLWGEVVRCVCVGGGGGGGGMRDREAKRERQSIDLVHSER